MFGAFYSDPQTNPETKFEQEKSGEASGEVDPNSEQGMRAQAWENFADEMADPAEKAAQDARAMAWENFSNEVDATTEAAPEPEAAPIVETPAEAALEESPFAMPLETPLMPQEPAIEAGGMPMAPESSLAMPPSLLETLPMSNIIIAELVEASHTDVGQNALDFDRIYKDLRGRYSAREILAAAEEIQPLVSHIETNIGDMTADNDPRAMQIHKIKVKNAAVATGITTVKALAVAETEASEQVDTGNSLIDSSQSAAAASEVINIAEMTDSAAASTTSNLAEQIRPVTSGAIETAANIQQTIAEIQESDSAVKDPEAEAQAEAAEGEDTQLEQDAMLATKNVIEGISEAEASNNIVQRPDGTFVDVETNQIVKPDDQNPQAISRF